VDSKPPKKKKLLLGGVGVWVCCNRLLGMAAGGLGVAVSGGCVAACCPASLGLAPPDGVAIA